MTHIQKARLLGFNASLQQRGVFLKVLPGGQTFKGLVHPITPENPEYTLGNYEREASQIHALRSDVKGIEIGVGTVIEEYDSDGVLAATHRVTKVSDHSRNIATVFSCESSGEELV